MNEEFSDSLELRSALQTSQNRRRENQKMPVEFERKWQLADQLNELQCFLIGWTFPFRNTKVTRFWWMKSSVTLSNSESLDKPHKIAKEKIKIAYEIRAKVTTDNSSTNWRDYNAFWLAELPFLQYHPNSGWMKSSVTLLNSESVYKPHKIAKWESKNIRRDSSEEANHRPTLNSTLFDWLNCFRKLQLKMFTVNEKFSDSLNSECV